VAELIGETFEAELLTIAPIFVGVSMVKSAFAISVARPNAKTNTSEIVFFILLAFQSLLVFSPR